MTDVAQEILGDGADQGSLREFYVALRLRVDFDPSTRTVTLDGTGGEVSPCPRGDLNPHAPQRALAPQASASTYSATRTRAPAARSATEL